MRKLTNWNDEKEDNDGLEALQTDIMRFMAIIGFCLLAIFALVKSVQSTSMPNTDDNRRIEAIAKQLEQQQRHNTELKRQNQLLQRQLVQTEQQVQRELEAQRRSVKKQPEHVAKSVVKVVPPVRTVTPTITSIKVVKPKPEPKPEPKPGAAATSIERPVTTPPVRKPAKKGYSLRFSDDQALLALLDAGQIKVLAIAGDRIYQAQNINGNRVFVLKNSGLKSYNQLFDDIPEPLQKAWDEQYGRQSPNWGVVLPESIVAQIKHLMGEYQAGEFSIDSRGQVIHTDF